MQLYITRSSRALKRFGKMKYNKNKNTKVNTKKSNVKKDNNIASSLTKREQPGKIDIPNSNDALFDFEINEEFMEENIKNNLVRPRHNHTQKFAPFTRVSKKKRKNRSLQTPF